MENIYKSEMDKINSNVLFLGHLIRGVLEYHDGVDKEFCQALFIKRYNELVDSVNLLLSKAATLHHELTKNIEGKRDAARDL